MSALPPKADIDGRHLDIRFVPKADISGSCRTLRRGAAHLLVNPGL